MFMLAYVARAIERQIRNWVTVLRVDRHTTRAWQSNGRSSNIWKAILSWPCHESICNQSLKTNVLAVIVFPILFYEHKQQICSLSHPACACKYKVAGSGCPLFMLFLCPPSALLRKWIKTPVFIGSPQSVPRKQIISQHLQPLFYILRQRLLPFSGRPWNALWGRLVDSYLVSRVSGFTYCSVHTQQSPCLWSLP